MMKFYESEETKEWYANLDIVEKLRSHIMHDIMGRRHDGAISIKTLDEAIAEIIRLRRLMEEG